MLATILRSAGETGGGSPVYAVSITDQGIFRSVSQPFVATASYKLGTDGIAYRISGSTAAIAGQWLNPADATEADLYEARVTILSGSLSTGTPNVWQALTSDLLFSRRQALIGTSTCSLRVEIRLIAAPATILGTATVQLTARVNASG